MKPSRPAQLLMQSLVAVLCGAAACTDAEPDPGARPGALGGGGAAGIASGGQAGALAAGNGTGGSSGGIGGATSDPAGSGGVGGGGAGAAGSGGAIAGTGGMVASGSGGAVAGTGGMVASGSGGTVAGGGGKAPGFACVDPAPVIVDGAPNGMALCADGGLVRTGPTSCKLPDFTNNPACPTGGAGGAAGAGGASEPATPEYSLARCADLCLAAAHGRPRAFPGAGGSTYRCEYFCEVDADCPAGRVCACDGAGAGRCVQAGCTTNVACGAGDACRLASIDLFCGYTEPGLLCVGVSDQCVEVADCGPPNQPPGYYARCAAANVQDTLVCHGAAGCGRPIYVGEIARLATLVRAAAWC